MTELTPIGAFTIGILLTAFMYNSITIMILLYLYRRKNVHDSQRTPGEIPEQTAS